MLSEPVSVLLGFGGGVAAAFALFLILYFTQDRAAGLGRFLTGVSRACGSFAQRIYRAWVKARVQRYANRIVRKGARDRPYLATKMRLRWQSPTVTRESFFESERFVVCVPRDFERDDVLIDLMFLFVSKSLLVKVKRFLSDVQRDALNIYYTVRLLETESPRLSEHFIDDYAPARLGRESADYVAAFDTLERYGFFEDLMIPELELVGEKLATASEATAVGREVAALTDKLLDLTQRGSGEDINTLLERRYIRLAVVLVGRKEKLEQSLDPYVDYIRYAVMPRQIDSIYLLSDSTKRHDVDEIADVLSQDFAVRRSTQRRGMLLSRTASIYIVSLRAKHTSSTSSGLLFQRERVRFSSDDDAAAAIDPRGQNGRVTGAIKFVADAGWGFIDLDDPAFERDAWFREDHIVRRPAVVGAGDRVECKILREGARLTATEVRILLSHAEYEEGEGSRGDGGGDERGQSVLSGSPAPAQVPTESPGTIRELAVEIVELLDAESAQEVDLATLGWRLKSRYRALSYGDYGCSSLLDLVEAAAVGQPSIRVDRRESGHPFVWLDREA